MNNNTRVRLHLSKNLFESIAKEILAESKKPNMSGGAYTEAVKQPKQSKAQAASPEVKKTNKGKTMEENKFATQGMEESTGNPVMDILTTIVGVGGLGLGSMGILKLQNALKAKDPELYSKLQNMRGVVGKADPSKNLEESEALGSIQDILTTILGVGGVGLGSLGIAKLQNALKAKAPDLYKGLQGLHGAVGKADPSKNLEESEALTTVQDILTTIASVGGLGLGSMGILKLQNALKAKDPELYKKLQGMRGAVGKADPSKNI